jgi:Fe2+ or Zn2+ uptake regulation protein
MRRIESHSHNLISLLHGVGLKSTVARIRVVSLFLTENRPLRIKDIHQLLGKISPPVDMVTIYRTIEILRDKNLAHRVDFGEDATYYELTLDGHNHHYITCTGCAKHSRVDFCLFEEHESQVLEKIPNFSIISGHIVEFLGICKKCSEKKSKKLPTKKGYSDFPVGNNVEI